MNEAYSLVKLSNSFVVDKNRKEVYSLKFNSNGELEEFNRVCAFKFDGRKYTLMKRDGSVSIGIVERAMVVLNSLVGDRICSMASM